MNSDREFSFVQCVFAQVGMPASLRFRFNVFAAYQSSITSGFTKWDTQLSITFLKY